MVTFVTVIHIITIIFLVLVVLIQAGKGAEISASFGGSSQTVFGSSGGQNFFTKFTYGMAALFMVTSITLTLMTSRQRKSVFEGVSTAQTSAPVAGQASGQPAATTEAKTDAPPAGTEAAPTPSDKK